jgi:hypothetical protein
MKKRRVTVDLDPDVLTALEAPPGLSPSATGDAALPEARHGAPSAQELAAADALLAAVARGDDLDTGRR